MALESEQKGWVRCRVVALTSPLIERHEHTLTLGALGLVGGRILSQHDAFQTSRDADGRSTGCWIEQTLLTDLQPLDPSWVTLLVVVGGEWGRRGIAESWARLALKHEHVGGVTDWKGLCLSNHWAIPPLEPSVRRNISHVLEHGDRPVPCSEKLDFPHLPVDGLLPLTTRVLLGDVAFHNFSCRTNWGRRQLNRKEISGAMDLPLWFSGSTLFDA